jgi:hypothetical protein
MRLEPQQACFRRPGAKQRYIIKGDKIRAMFQLRIFCHLVCYIKFSNEQNNNIYRCFLSMKLSLHFEGRLQFEGV